jgi:arylsulfatase A-like enzyme
MSPTSPDGKCAVANLPPTLLRAFAAVVLAFCAASFSIGAETTGSLSANRRVPNIVIILADDMGFSDAGCYGGEIATPNLDRLAAGGLRFTQFYNTARCWPSRSCILTGYYAQQIRMDPPHDRLPSWTRVLPHYLKPLGYRCYHSGKWHLFGAPRAVADGGFDHSYKLDDQDRYFSPTEHYEDDRRLPRVQPESGFYATRTIADHAIRCLKEHAQQHADKPFFHYLAFTSPHFPLHALAGDVARYRDRYLEGWDAVRQRRWERLREMGIVNCALSPLDGKFTPRYFQKKFLDNLGPGEIEHATPWADLTPEQRRFQATKMAIHAAMVDRMDREIGRVLDQLRAMDAMQNTVIFFLSDNGADATILIRGDGHSREAAPGSGRSFLCIGPGWASASNAPFRRHKIWVHEGGISTPLIVHWPQGIRARGELRRDLGHVTDFVPTLLELAGSRAGDTYRGTAVPPLPGRSLVPAFARDGAAAAKEFVFFKHEGNRALRMGDWKLVSAQENSDAWELYNLAGDRCEMVDLAVQQPQRLEQLKAKWLELDAQYSRLAETR